MSYLEEKETFYARRGAGGVTSVIVTCDVHKCQAGLSEGRTTSTLSYIQSSQEQPRDCNMFNPTRAKVQLKLSVNRLQMLQNKKNMLAQQQRKEIARLLEIGKEESARIRVRTWWTRLIQLPQLFGKKRLDARRMLTVSPHYLPLLLTTLKIRWSISFARILAARH